MLHQCHLDFSSGIPASIALHHWLSKQTDVPVKSSYHDYIGEGSTLRLAVQLNRHAWEGFVPSSFNLCSRTSSILTTTTRRTRSINVDLFEKACYYNDGNAGGIDFGNDTFKDRCYYNVDIFEDGDFILSNNTFGSWFLVRVPEDRCDFNDDTFKARCYFSIGTFENRCYESDPTKRGLRMTTFQPRQWSLAPHLGEDQEEKEEDSPSFGRCRPLSRVADSGPKAKVNHHLISTFLH